MAVVKLSWSQVLVPGLLVIIQGPRLQIFPLGFLRLFVCQFGCVAVKALFFVISNLVFHRGAFLASHSEAGDREHTCHRGVTVGTPLQGILIDALNCLDSRLASAAAPLAIDNPVFVYRHEEWSVNGAERPISPAGRKTNHPSRFCQGDSVWCFRTFWNQILTLISIRAGA